ncbi:MAG: hypothetical protein LUD15_09930 [Bacteroides sp.]|nr:hypothetical protein [Bacteroides sp.]
MKNSLLLLIIVTFPVLLPAQEEWLSSALEESLGYDTHNKKEWYKGQILKKERTGMGILKMKDGKIYIGDLLKGKMNGTGMMLSPIGDKISNCKEYAIYVGNWKQGIKSGKGTCYNRSGDIIYSGNFQNNAPVETYPSQEEILLNYFSFIECDNEELYLGEIKEGDLNGYRIIRWENGDI